MIHFELFISVSVSVAVAVVHLQRVDGLEDGVVERVKDLEGDMISKLLGKLKMLVKLC